MTDLKLFSDMLTRAGVGHGLRHDYNPAGTAVQVEEEDGKMITEFAFDADGKLLSVHCYEHEEG